MVGAVHCLSEQGFLNTFKALRETSRITLVQLIREVVRASSDEEMRSEEEPTPFI